MLAEKARMLSTTFYRTDGPATIKEDLAAVVPRKPTPPIRVHLNRQLVPCVVIELVWRRPVIVRAA